MYSSIVWNPASYRVIAAEVYVQFPSGFRRVSRPVRHLSTWSRKPPRVLPIRGVTTKVSDPKSNTACTTALNNKTDTCGSAPSLLRILVILFHTTLSQDKFLTTVSQSLSAAEITRPRYWKEVTISRGRPYELNALVVTSLSSSAAKRRHFLFAPRFHCAVHQCFPFSDLHGTRMSHRGHRGWGRFTYSSITTVSLTCRFQKCTLVAVHVNARPLHPSTRQGLGTSIAGNAIL